MMDNDLPQLEPIEDLPVCSDAEIRRLRLGPISPLMRTAEAECRAGDTDRAIESVQRLLQAGMHVEDLQVCLLEAVQCGNEDVVQMLLFLGVPVRLETVKAAINQGSTPLLSRFLDYGWNINEAEAWCLPEVLG